LQDPSKTNGDNVSNVRHEIRTYRNKTRDYLKVKLISLKQTVRTKKLGTFNNEVTNGHRPRT